jgi:hypothetical protein
MVRGVLENAPRLGEGLRRYSLSKRDLGRRLGCCKLVFETTNQNQMRKFFVELELAFL